MIIFPFFMTVSPFHQNQTMLYCKLNVDNENGGYGIDKTDIHCIVG